MTYEIGKINTTDGWQPIATVPLDRAVEIATLPADGHARSISVVQGFEDLRDATETHWRELTPMMRKAIERAMKEARRPPAGTG